MAISIKQQAANSAAYQTTPLVVTLPSGTTAGSRIAVVVEALKSGYPYPFSTLNANTPAPTITDDNGTTYTLVDSIVNQTQEVTSGVTSPDASGHFPSAYVYVSSAAVTAGTQNVSISAFYADEITSPPMVKGRPVFNGGIHAQVFEIAGLLTGVDAHSKGSAYNASLGPNLITTSGAAVIIEVGFLMDSSALISNVNATQQFAGTLYSGSSHFVVQTTIVGTGTASTGFTNSLRYTGGIIAVSLK